MSEQDVDDVAFLTGTNVQGSDCQNTATVPKKSLYENNGVVVCSQKRALFIATIVFAVLFAASLIIAYTGPQSDCTCVGEKPANYIDEDSNTTKTFIPRATNGQIFPWNNVRLPTFIKPLRYNITIHPNITTLDVKGQVSIEFMVEKETHFIVLHSKNLTISEKMIQDRKGHYIKIVKLLEFLGRNQIYIEIKDKFKKRNNYTLHLRYTSKLSKTYEGFYVSSYVNSDGEKKYLATTHFEPTYARMAFPCFDEPQFKAKFKLSIFRDRFHIALFNMPVINTEDVGFYMGTGLISVNTNFEPMLASSLHLVPVKAANNLYNKTKRAILEIDLRDDFEESVEMSTYLVAFVVCDYTHINRVSEKGVSVSVYTPPPFISQADFALETATHIMDYFEEFFNVPYPLPKEDLIAIPDFSSGAMENWGLITYRETAILYDPIQTSTYGHQWVAIVVAHELAHQWFGNLVTMKWWNDLWLNEGFAIFLEYRGIDSFKPEWRLMEQFILDKTQPALALDALISSHPIAATIDDPAEIDDIFDTISYSKGAAVLLMLANFLQQETLQNGLNDYLTTYKYGNAEAKDLWNSFSKHTNQSLDVKHIMDTWTQQMGFPLITLTREGNTITANQERFLLTPDHGENNTVSSEPKSKYDYKWYVPLTYFTDQDSIVTNVWMNMSDVAFDIPSEVKWIKANVNQLGFYRVMYDETMWVSIIEELKENHTAFSVADRASLIDDAFTLCRSGLLNASIPLELTLYLKKERDYVPWATALEHFQAWSLRLSESLAYKRFIQYMRQLLEPVTQYVGWKGTESHLEKLMRTKILKLAVLFEVNQTVAEARVMFDRFMTKNEPIAPDLKEIVYSAGIKYGGMHAWEHCWNIYNSTEVPSERNLFLKALGATSDPWILQRYLLKTLDTSMVKPQDVKTVMAVAAANPEGRLLAWRHLKAHWPMLHDIFKNASFMMGNLISVVTVHLSTPYDYFDVSRYFNGTNVSGFARALEQSLETIKLNIKWVQRNEADIFLWLNDYLKGR